MTTTTAKNKIPVKAGESLFFLVPSFSFSMKPNDLAGAFLVISERGQTITVTDDLIEASKDREGNSWLELIDDEAGQIARWGHHAFARGEAPEDMTSWVPGTIDQTLEYEARRQIIRDSVRDPDELALKLRELQRSPLGQNLPTFSNRTAYDMESPKNGESKKWDVS